MSDTDSAASRLCVACGMCCDGTIFHHVRLQPKDSAKALAALGLKLKRKRKHDHILQPCPAHQDCRCSIYAARPERCRLFECRQIQAVATGEISEAEASAKIREALDRVRSLLQLFQLAGETNSKGPLTVRYEKIIALPLDPTAGDEAVALRARLIREMQEFDALVEADFRPAEPAPSNADAVAEFLAQSGTEPVPSHSDAT